MSNLAEVVIVIVIVVAIILQTLCGYIGNKYLGTILPLCFLGLVGVFLFKGVLGFNFRDITMPLLIFIFLLARYEAGKKSKTKRIKRELEKMKAKDISNNN